MKNSLKFSDNILFNVLSNNQNKALAILISIFICYISCINILSIIAYSVSLAVLILLNHLFLKEKTIKVIAVYTAYCILALTLLILQQKAYPQTFGLTPGQRGLGTDDVYYYTQAVRGVSNSLILPPTHYTFESMSEYSKILNVFARLFAIVYPVHPIDLVLVSVMLFSLLPLATSKFIVYFTNSISIERIALHLTFFCPLILSNGLIIMRDAPIAMFFMLALLNTVRKRYFFALLCFSFVTYLRIGSGLISFIAFFFLVITLHIQNSKTEEKKQKRKFRRKPLLLISALLVCVAGYFTFPAILQYLNSKGISGGLIRDANITLSLVEENQGLVFKKIAALPSIIRIPATTAWYFFSPIIRSTELFKDSVFLPRAVFEKFGAPIMLALTFPFFLSYIARSLRNKRVLFGIVIPYFLMLIVLSLSSMQIRHKVLILPLYYSLVSIDMTILKWNWARYLGAVISLGYLGFQVFQL